MRKLIPKLIIKNIADNESVGIRYLTESSGRGGVIRAIVTKIKLKREIAPFPLP
jgi:hypothetical protein